MQITSSMRGIYPTLENRQAGSTAAVPNSTSTAVSAASSSRSGVDTADFTHMTRQQLSDWMNGQIKSGKMTLDESTPFLGMTMKVSVTTGQPVDMSTDTTAYDFMNVARQGSEGARWRHDDQSAKALGDSLATMQRAQGAVTKVDVTA